jgi:hypothetical protein
VSVKQRGRVFTSAWTLKRRRAAGRASVFLCCQEFCLQSLNALRVVQFRFHNRALQDSTRPQPAQYLHAGWSIGIFQHFQLYLSVHLSEMSDFEDEMDVDGPLPNHSIQFSSDNTTTRGKRIVADLPVEAEDNLPWYAMAKGLG